jgi:hypothetical protein
MTPSEAGSRHYHLTANDRAAAGDSATTTKGVTSR